MTIDMSNNLVENFTNDVPIYVKQFEETPDSRFFYLNNNRITYISDHLLQDYGACSSVSVISTAYFIVGISNMLLTGNNLICDCESYYLVSFINDRLSDFPQITNGSALINQAICSSPASQAGQTLIFSNFSEADACSNYVLSSDSSIFCSVYTNETNSTIAPPTYWTTSTVATTSNTGSGTNNQTGSGSGSGGGGNVRAFPFDIRRNRFYVELEW